MRKEQQTHNHCLPAKTNTQTGTHAHSQAEKGSVTYLAVGIEITQKRKEKLLQCPQPQEAKNVT